MMAHPKALLAILLLGASTTSIVAEPAAAPPVKALAGIGVAGSERLWAFALTRPAMGQSVQVRGSKSYAHMGYFGAPGSIAQRWLNAVPIVTWDANINGGQGSETFLLFGLPFKVAEDQVAKAGLVLGASVTTGVKMNVATRLAATLRAGVSAVHSPKHDLDKFNGTAQSCLSYLHSPQTIYDACTSYALQDVDLSQTERFGVSSKMTRFVMSPVGYHEISGELSYAETRGADYGQSFVTLSSLTALADAKALFAAVSVGTNEEGAQLLDYRVSAGYGFKAFARTQYLGLSYAQYSGGLFLGEARDEETYGVELRSQLTQSASLSVTYDITTAAQDFFEREALGLSLNTQF